MAGFQIRTKEGEALSISELDKEAAAFWGKEVHHKRYADPGEEPDPSDIRACMNRANNWFDAIGWYIAESKEIAYPENMSWYQIMHAMVGNSLLRCLWDYETLDYTKEVMMGAPKDGDRAPVLNSILCVANYYDPYFALIKHWADKGYTPHRVE